MLRIGSTNSISGSIPTVAKTRRVAELKKVRASSWSARAAASSAYAVFIAVQQARHRRWSPSAWPSPITTRLTSAS